jgi:hypothetical protein
VSIAEGALRNKARRRKEGRYADADQIIKTLLSLSSSSPPPTAWDLADRMWDGRVLIGSLANVIERLHERETTPRPGRRGNSRGRRPAGKIGGGGGFVLGDYKNNSVERRRAECERISGLLDLILEAAMMLEDGEEGGSSSSSFAAVADCADGRRRATRTTNKDSWPSRCWPQRSGSVRPTSVAAGTQRFGGGLTACWPKIARGATGWGGMGGDNKYGGSLIRNYARRSIDGKGQDQERRKRRIEGGERAIGRLVKTEISAADAQDGQSPPPNPNPV